MLELLQTQNPPILGGRGALRPSSNKNPYADIRRRDDVLAVNFELTQPTIETDNLTARRHQVLIARGRAVLVAEAVGLGVIVDSGGN
jgi:hypothetical protein